MVPPDLTAEAASFHLNALERSLKSKSLMGMHRHHQYGPDPQPTELYNYDDDLSESRLLLNHPKGESLPYKDGLYKLFNHLKLILQDMQPETDPTQFQVSHGKRYTPGFYKHSYRITTGKFIGSNAFCQKAGAHKIESFPRSVMPLRTRRSSTKKK